jgi:hypothetical protein
MQMKSDGAEIDRAENVELYGEWIKFTDGEGASVKIAIDVVLELAAVIKAAKAWHAANPWFGKDIDATRTALFFFMRLL